MELFPFKNRVDQKEWTCYNMAMTNNETKTKETKMKTKTTHKVIENENGTGGTVVRDGKTYETIKIKGVHYMIEDQIHSDSEKYPGIAGLLREYGCARQITGRKPNGSRLFTFEEYGTIGSGRFSAPRCM